MQKSLPVLKKLACRLRDAAAKADLTAGLNPAARHEEQTQGLENELGKTFGTSEATNQGRSCDH